MSLSRSRYSCPTGSDLIVSEETPLLIAVESRSIAGTMAAVTSTVSVTPCTDIFTSTVVSCRSCTSTCRVRVAIPDSVNSTV